MGNTVIRCVHGSTLREIKSGTYKAEKVGVYYGFENYKRTAKQILELINIVQEEMHGIELDEMEVYEITRAQSDRHAHYTMVYISVDADVVRENIGDYIIL